MFAQLSSLEAEFIKAALNLGVALTTVVLGWLVGQRLTVQWNIRQKHRELDLTSGQEFYRLYGEFFAVWKVWNEFKDNPAGVEGLTRKELFLRACTAEGGMESLLVRIATNRILSPAEIQTLGKFRQAFQSLRQTIRIDEPLRWNRSNHIQYQAFKSLSAEVSTLIISMPGKRWHKRKGAIYLSEITSNAFENKWC